MSTDLRIDLRCPVCRRKVRSAPLMRCATTGVRRTCGTGHAWHVTIRPLSVTSEHALHQVDWSPLREAA